MTNFKNVPLPFPLNPIALPCLCFRRELLVVSFDSLSFVNPRNICAEVFIFELKIGVRLVKVCICRSFLEPVFCWESYSVVIPENKTLKFSRKMTSYFLSQQEIQATLKLPFYTSQSHMSNLMEWLLYYKQNEI
jgi:hypothetical protein